MTSHPEPDDQQIAEDRAWENRGLILAMLAPRSAPRPARRGTGATVAASVGDGDLDVVDEPGLLSRGSRWCGHKIAAGARRANAAIPPEKRVRAAVLCAALFMVGVAGVAGVRYLVTDVNPAPAAETRPPVAASAPPPTKSMPQDTVLTGMTVTDRCPQDPNHSNANLAVDGDLDTAWKCTRVEDKDGQLLMVDFGRQVTLTQLRVIGGFDSIGPSGDQWPNHQVVTELEIWFPKDLGRDPVTIKTEGARDYRGIDGGLQPPATVSKLILRVAATMQPPPAPTTAGDGPPPVEDEDKPTTVAISEIQFIGYDGPARLPA